MDYIEVAPRKLPVDANIAAVTEGDRTIAVIEDEQHIADLIGLYLRRDGHRVLHFSDGESALDVIERDGPDLVVLDIGLAGDLDGFAVCRQIRAVSAVPILILTARDEEIDRVLGFELGADDYVTKPFSPRELSARIKAILRRTQGTENQSHRAVLRSGVVEVDLGRREARVEGRAVPLATREFELLAYLARNRGLALSRQQLLDAVWGVGWYGDERTVDVHVAQLRKKLGEGLPIRTVWGVGYRLD